MPTLQVRFWAENSSVGVSQWAAESSSISQDRGGLTTQRIDNKVRERVWEIAQYMSISNMQGAGPEQWDLLIHWCVTQTGDLASNRPLWKRYLADKTNLDVHILKKGLDKFVQVGVCQTKNRHGETSTTKKKLVHIGMYFIAPMLLSFLLMMSGWRGRWGRQLGSQVVTDEGASRCLDRSLCRAI